MSNEEQCLWWTLEGRIEQLSSLMFDPQFMSGPGTSFEGASTREEFKLRVLDSIKGAAASLKAFLHKEEMDAKITALHGKG